MYMPPRTHSPRLYRHRGSIGSDETLQRQIEAETEANTEFNARLGTHPFPGSAIGMRTDEDLWGPGSDRNRWSMATTTSTTAVYGGSRGPLRSTVGVQPAATNHRPTYPSRPAGDRGRPEERGENEFDRNNNGREDPIPPTQIQNPTPTLAKSDGPSTIKSIPHHEYPPQRTNWVSKIAGWFGRRRLDSSSSAPEPRSSLRTSRAIHSIITCEMPVSEILNHLGKHGCKDMTDQLNLSKSSEYPISSGGFGDVYRGSCHNGDRVAIKCLRLRLDRSEIAKKQFKHAARELYVWSRCNHPNVLGLKGMAQYRNQIAMVSPWMKYGNVRQLLSQLPRVDRYALCAQIIEGVVYLHGTGVVHGDLKGDNVLVSEDLIPKLTDFGNAALREYTLQFSTTTSKAGTSLNWVAPEILAEETGLTAEGDVYSLGMEVITGIIPYAGMQPYIIMKKIGSGVHPVRPVEHIPPDTHYSNLVWSLLEKCWAYNPQDRPATLSMKAVILERKKGQRVVK